MNLASATVQGIIDDSRIMPHSAIIAGGAIMRHLLLDYEDLISHLPYTFVSHLLAVQLNIATNSDLLANPVYHQDGDRKKREA